MIVLWGHVRVAAIRLVDAVPVDGLAPVYLLHVDPVRRRDCPRYYQVVCKLVGITNRVRNACLQVLSVQVVQIERYT